jgi:hypothetical protein
VYVKVIGNWSTRFRDGQCIEVHDRDGAVWLASGMAEVVTAEDVREYAATMAAADRLVARAVDEHFSETPRAAGKTAGRRVVSQDQWRAELGQDRSGYWQASDAFYKHIQARS